MILATSFTTTSNLVLPLVDGISQGCAYGLLGLGLVLLYKSNRIFNFAQGEFATVAGLVALMFDTGYGWLPKLPYALAIIAGILASVLFAVGTERLVIRPMFERSRLVLVVATIGVSLLMIGLEGLAYPHPGFLRSVSDALKVSTNFTTLDRVPVPLTAAVNLGVLVVLALGALVFFRRTSMGSAILAISQDPTAAKVVGIPVGRVSMVTWGLAGLLAGVAGVLLAPNLSVTPGSFTGTVLTVAFAAAVLGGMTSLPGAFVGGLAMGLVEAFANADYSFVPGLRSLQTAQSEVAVAVFLLLVLLVRPRGLFGAEA